MSKDLNKDFVARRQELRAVLIKAASDFLDRKGGLRFCDLRESFETALQLLVVAKIECSPHPSVDRLSDGQDGQL